MCHRARNGACHEATQSSTGMLYLYAAQSGALCDVEITVGLVMFGVVKSLPGSGLGSITMLKLGLVMFGVVKALPGSGLGWRRTRAASNQPAS